MKDVKVYTKMIPPTPGHVRCTLVVDGGIPMVFDDRDEFDAELKKQKIDPTEIKYFPGKTEEVI